MLTSFINLKEFPVKPVLSILLQDKTTQKNIIWATGSYADLGPQYADDVQMTEIALIGIKSPIESAKTWLQEKVNYFKGLFNFQWKLPEFKLPRISVTWNDIGWGIKLPNPCCGGIPAIVLPSFPDGCP